MSKTGIYKCYTNVISNKNYYIALLLIILTTVILVIFFKKFPGGKGHDGYFQIAQSVAAGKGYSIDGEIITGRSPAYTYLLSIGFIYGFTYWWVWVVNYLSCLISAVLLKQILIKYEIHNSGLISILIACNPLVLWLAKNSMTYVFSFLLITIILWCFANKRFLFSSPFSLLLFFTHPSFGIISLLLLVSLIYFSQNKLKSIALVVFSFTFILGYNIQIKKHYGGYPLFSATGAGFQYLLARNEYVDGNSKDIIDIREKVGVNYYTASFTGTVTNHNHIAFLVDNLGRGVLFTDISTPAFFIPKVLNGMKNTLLSGLMPDMLVLIIFIPLIFYLLHVNNFATNESLYKDRDILLFMSLILFLQLSIYSVVGFKMRYSAYFLPFYPLFIPLYLLVSKINNKVK